MFSGYRSPETTTNQISRVAQIRRLTAWLMRWVVTQDGRGQDKMQAEQPQVLPSLANARSLEDISGYRHYALVLQEAVEAKRQLASNLGIDGTNSKAYVFGSASRDELRTTADDPDDPSDVDLLVIVPPEIAEHLDTLFQKNAPLTRSRTNESHYYRYSMKLQSSTGELNPTEVFIYTEQDLQVDMRSTSHPDRAQFAQSAVRDAVSLP